MTALVALVLACVAVFLVANVAWPFPKEGTDIEDAVAETADGDKAASGNGRLRTGVALTYAAVVTMAIAASASWWPNTTDAFDGEDRAGVTVEITAHNGATACGQLLGAPSGTIRLATASGDVEVATSDVAAVTPADSC